MEEKENICRVLGGTIRGARVAKGWSRNEFAAQIGRDPLYVSQLESGELDVDIAMLLKCADSLGVNISELLSPFDKDTHP